MAIETVAEAQYELQVALEEIIADMGDDAPDEGSAMLDLWRSMSHDWPDVVASEVARREFGYVPTVGAYNPAMALDWDSEPRW